LETSLRPIYPDVLEDKVSCVSGVYSLGTASSARTKLRPYEGKGFLSGVSGGGRSNRTGGKKRLSQGERDAGGTKMRSEGRYAFLGSEKGTERHN